MAKDKTPKQPKPPTVDQALAKLKAVGRKEVAEMEKVNVRVTELREARAEAEAAFNKALMDESKKDEPKEPVN